MPVARTMLTALVLAAMPGCGLLMPIGFQVATTTHVEPPLSRMPPVFVLKRNDVSSLNAAHVARYAEVREGTLADVREGELLLDLRLEHPPKTASQPFWEAYNIAFLIPSLLVAFPPFVSYHADYRIHAEALDARGRCVGHGYSQGGYVRIGYFPYMLFMGDLGTKGPAGTFPDLGEALEDLLEHLEEPCER